MSELSDDLVAPLLEAAQRGDAGAFERLIGPYIPSLRRITFAFCRTRADADDLAQEALLKAYRSLNTFQRGVQIAPWLYSVTRSVCHDWYRKHRARGRGRELELDEGDALEASAEDFDQHALLAAKSDAERLWIGIRALPPALRVPLVLFDIEGLSYEEVARIERVPLGTVRSRLSRARASLTSLLVPEESAEVPTAGTLSRPISSTRLGLAK